MCVEWAGNHFGLGLV